MIKTIQLFIAFFLLMQLDLTGQQWKPQVSGATNNLFSLSFPVNDQVGHICGSEGTILKTEDGGKKWTIKNSGTNFDLYEIHFFDTNKGFAVGTGNTLLLTTDGGEIWSKINIFGTDDSYYYRNMWFLNENIGFIIGGRSGNNGVILKTVNGGISWEELTINSFSAVYGIYFTSANKGYFSNFEGEISKTIDGGATWKKVPSGTSNSLIGLYFTDEDTGYACGFDGTILKTSDQGETWELKPTNNDEYLTEIVFLDEYVGFAIGGDANSSTILKTTDKGETWSEEVTSTSRLFGAEFLSFTTGYACGFNGSILKIENIVAASDKVSELANNFKIFPNPTDNFLTIDLGTSIIKTGTKLKILNTLGMVVHSEEIIKQLTNINLSTFGGSGIYYVMISDPSNINGTEIHKVILLQ